MTGNAHHEALPMPDVLSLTKLASITVTFNPDLKVLERQLSATADLGAAIVIDNASGPALANALEDLVASMPWVRFLRNVRNEGLASALNRGMAEVARLDREISAVLLLDQDSLFDCETPRALLENLNALQAQTGTLCCVGPVLRDPDSGMNHGFHYIAKGWRWARAYPDDKAPPCAVETLNGSGTMMPLQLVQALGGMEDGFFIDHIDTEWSFRVTSRGGRLYGIPSVSFDHRMGEVGRRIWLLGWRVWPERSPQRHYYLFRNTVRLARRSYVPAVWKSWAFLKLVLTLVVTFVIDRRRWEQLKQMMRGIRAGASS